MPEQGRPVTTGNYGHFMFTGLIPGTYRLTCAALGYEPVAKLGIQITSPEEPVTLQMVLPPEVVVHQRVEVTAQAPKATEQAAAPPATMNNQQIKSLPLVVQKFKAALPMIPGVIRTPDGRIAVKGALENQGTLLVDGAETVDPVSGSFSIDVPLDAVESVDVFKSAYQTEYGRFAGGLTTVQTKAPTSQWHYQLSDFVPTPRLEAGHLMGVQDDAPRLFFGGPAMGEKFNFSEAFTYDYSAQPVRGLPWPNNVSRRQGWTSFSDFYYAFSAQHLSSVDVKVFPVRRQYDNIDTLIPQISSANYGQSGYSIGLHDHYLFAGGGILTTLAQFTQFDSYSHGQGTQDLMITPTGWEGNFFNAWTRKSTQQEAQENYLFPRKHWRGGAHDVKVGGDLVHREYQGTSLYHPVQLLRADDSLAEEIDFGPAGHLAAGDTEGAFFAEDHWIFNRFLSIDYGLRFSSQTLGEHSAFSPRGGLVLSPAKNGRTILRGGAGVFYDRLPLLAGDYNLNASRQATLFNTSGVALGPPTVYLPYYEEFGEHGKIVPSGTRLGSTPYNVTWNTEIDQEIRPNIIARVSFLASRTYEEFTVNQQVTSPTTGLLLLSNQGASRYREFEATLRVRPSPKADFNISYVNSQARGDLNTMSSVYVPYEQPVIQPNLFGTLPTNVPDRVVTWGRFNLPQKFTVSPVLDWHSGFPYSLFDVTQNYVGPPNSLRIPAFLSLDLQASKDLMVPIIPWLRKHPLRGTVRVFNVTNHGNYRDVYNTVTSPYFGDYAGFQHRFYSLSLDIVY
jgi:hypothetical protein